ncbi:hypothetical protein BJ138DRAFT_1191335 [Hygrophoropsis aurantiaca]|uniref:Uncharacterized protein n=1 Tax=Hygrophoropsis aurantiaca TaxID=72124 RepID=A0ACB8ABG5_9AGAM|nr:hypothetical protein BJ138DRAFT_1191335 [Hygrophoropsis aurantiaca]
MDTNKRNKSIGILSLPAELVEGLIVTSVSLGWIGSISALSQTNRSFHNLIYNSPDNHLWREIFLATFDDPRPALNHLRNLSPSDPHLNADTFNWARAFQDRIRTETRMKSHTIDGLSKTGSAGIFDLTRSNATYRDWLLDVPESRLLSVLQTLLSVIATANPFPQTPISLTIVSSNVDVSPLVNAPPFPPLLLLLSSGYTPVLKCRNAGWFHDLLMHGYPPELTRSLFATIAIDVPNSHPYRPNLTPSSHWTGSKIGHLFHKLVCCTGFVPIPASNLSATTLQLTDDSDGESEFGPSEDISENQSKHPPRSVPSDEEQFADARILARRRVYDMRYLVSGRLWGPFQPVTRSSPVNLPSDTIGGDHDDGEDLTDEEDGDFTPIIQLIHGREANGSPDLSPSIQPWELVPDYVWLASARIVVEANLKEMLMRAGGDDPVSLDIVPTLRQMHTLRVGGSPGYWNVWADHPKDIYATSHTVNGEDSAEVINGWDWAGVTGIWRRCICWLDYRELLIHNLSVEKFIEHSEVLEEACRIVPTTVRITGYSKPPTPPTSSTPPLPTIHVEGESIGSDRNPNEGRKMKGTVSMIGDGATRWSTVSYLPGSNEPEWSSEAVQIGGPGSASGLLGMWTGALHERSDPLGPFWAWKVA